MEDAQQEHDLEMMGKEIRFEKDSAKKLGARAVFCGKMPRLLSILIYPPTEKIKKTF